MWLIDIDEPRDDLLKGSGELYGAEVRGGRGVRGEEGHHEGIPVVLGLNTSLI